MISKIKVKLNLKQQYFAINVLFKISKYKYVIYFLEVCSIDYSINFKFK